MRAKVLNEAPERTIAIVFEAGESVMEGLTRFAEEHALSASRLTAIGAFERARLGFFDWDAKDYVEIPVDEQVEVLALVGDVTLDGTERKVHAHVVLGRRDGTTRGGHLLEATVRPTLEVMLVESPGHLARELDGDSGLALIAIGRTASPRVERAR
jgi:predicted DNA-binding protein with PD1-like motif